MSLSKEQREIVQRILAAHQPKRYESDITVDGLRLQHFVVWPNVLRPELVASIHLARFLAGQPDLFCNKTVIDMGSGSGIQGIVMALLGAKRVLFSDIASCAVENTRLNVERFEVERLSEVYQGDLFEPISRQVDLVVFNHPFFAEQPFDGIPVSCAIMDAGNLIHRFLEEACRFSDKVIMPFYHGAGETNNPAIQGPKHGYAVSCVYDLTVETGLNPGKTSVFELSRSLVL